MEEATNPVLGFLQRRRSVVAKLLGEPGPTAEQLTQILTVAARVPDHKKLEPWRFIVLREDARARLDAEANAIRVAEASGEDTPPAPALVPGPFRRAPVVVVVVSSPRSDTPVPVWEQTLSAGAVCQNLLIASGSLGFGAQWITEWTAYSPGVAELLGLAPEEQVAGFVYIGTAQEQPKERPRPDLSRKVTYLTE